MKTFHVVMILVALTLLRGVWVMLQDVSPAEAYQWLCAARLAPAFFDGPPGTAWVVWLTEKSGWGMMLGARLLWPVIAGLAGWLVWIIGRRIGGDGAGGWALVLVNAAPVFNHAAVTVGPLLPAMFFVLLGTAAVFRAWEGSSLGWVLAGGFFAVAVWFRYEAVLVVLGFLGGTLASPRHRTLRDGVGLVCILVACGLALWFPLAWNAALEWVPVAGGTLQTAWEWKWTALPSALVGGHVSWIGVFVLLAGGAALFVGWRRRSRVRILIAAGGLPAVWWFYEGLRGLDAATAALLALTPLAIALAVFLIERRPAALATLAVASLGVTAWSLSQESTDRSLWAPIAAELRTAARELPAGEGESFFIAEDPGAAAILGLHVKTTRTAGYPPVFVPESPGLPNQFGLWPSYADFIESDVVVDEYFTEQKGVNPFIGRHALYLGRDLPQTIDGAFGEVIPLRTLRYKSREWTIFLCLNYQTLPL